MSADLRDMLHDLVAEQPVPPNWVGGVRHRAKVRGRRRKAAIGAVAVAVVGIAAAVPFHFARDDQRLVPAGPPPMSMTLTPSVAEATTGQVIQFTAVATSPDGAPIIQDPFVDASGTGFGPCPAPAPGSAGPDGTARRTFEASFDQAGVHTVEISALAPGCQDGSLKATAIIQVSDPAIVLTNDITIRAKVLSRPRAGQSDLVLDVTASGTRDKPSISGFYIDHSVLFIGDNCRPLGIFPARGPGVFHQVYRFRYDHPGPDTITLFASSLCSKQPGQARLDVKVNVEG